MTQPYDVTYQSGGDEHTQRVEAPDAASAASQIQTEHGREEGLYELIAVNLLDDEAAESEDDADPTNETDPDSATDATSLDESLTPS
ncbi:MAG TPA: hypothetical protein VGT61_03815 [Thermomicrobiales bacterium]|jgi:hypothetical protein|nr:hypothetical protein [Thermomicrobiales bacterium]